MGTRLIDSTPPANTRSSQPDATFWAAMLTASSPEAQKRLSCTPATVFGRPALIAAVLAMSAPWSPTGETQPSTTSSTRFGSRFSLRASVSCIRPTTRSTGLVVCSEPLLLPLPRGVRMASKTNASGIVEVSSGGWWLHHRLQKQTRRLPLPSAAMAYVIAGSCVKDDVCIEVCPADCIHPVPGAPDFETAEQL